MATLASKGSPLPARNPKATVSSPVTVRFGLTGMGVAVLRPGIVRVNMLARRAGLRVLVLVLMIVFVFEVVFVGHALSDAVRRFSRVRR